MFTILRYDADASNYDSGCYSVIGIFTAKEDADKKIESLVEEDRKSFAEEDLPIQVTNDMFGNTSVFVEGDLVISYQVKKIESI